jgi:hypothetical protein
LSHRPSKRHSLPGFYGCKGHGRIRSAPNLATLRPLQPARGSWDTRWHHARCSGSGSASNLDPLRPTSDWEVGRKKALIFLCLSNLSNLSNLFKEFIEKEECPQRIPRDFCQKGRTRWPRWTEPTTAAFLTPNLGSGGWTRLGRGWTQSRVHPAHRPQPRSKRHRFGTRSAMGSASRLRIVPLAEPTK